MKKNMMTKARAKLSVIHLLIGINFLFFLLTPTILFLFNKSSNFIYQKVQLSNDFSALVQKPWTIVTYAFFHVDFLHLLFNGILLYFVGVLFFNLFGTWRFLSVYFLGIVFGGLSFVVSYLVFPVLVNQTSALLGASAGIMAIFVGIATYTPKYKVYLFGVVRLPLWVLGSVVVLIDIVSIPIANTGGKIAHLGGAFVGFVWAYFLKNPIRIKKKTNHKDKSNKDIETQQRINLLLKKISKSGYESLTNQEKEFLFKASKK